MNTNIQVNQAFNGLKTLNKVKTEDDLIKVYNAVKPLAYDAIQAGDKTVGSSLEAAEALLPEVKPSVINPENNNKPEDNNAGDVDLSEDNNLAAKEFTKAANSESPNEQIHHVQKGVAKHNKQQQKAENEPEPDFNPTTNAAAAAQALYRAIKKLLMAVINAALKAINLFSQAIGKPTDFKMLDTGKIFNGGSEFTAENVESPEKIKEQRRGFFENLLTKKGDQIRQDLPKNLENGMPAAEALQAALNCKTGVLDPDQLRFPIDPKNPAAGDESISELMNKADKKSQDYDPKAEKRLQDAMKSKPFKQYRKDFAEQNKTLNALTKMFKNEDFAKTVKANPELQAEIKKFEDNHRQSGKLAEVADIAYKNHFGAGRGDFSAKVQNSQLVESPIVVFKSTVDKINDKAQKQEQKDKFNNQSAEKTAKKAAPTMQ